jgi:hypothetical protein
MAGPNLTEDELRQAAAEAGISPQELRVALAERHGGAAAVHAPRSLMGPPQRGMPVTHVESRIGMAPREALAAVRTSIERQTGKRGHHQGESEFDIVDEDQGLTYRMRVADDGGGGALVRVDIDPSSGKGTQALATTGVLGICATLVALGWLFAASTLWLGGIGIGVLGGLLIGRSNLKLRSAGRHAHAIAAQALMEAEDRVTIAPRGALPAADWP